MADTLFLNELVRIIKRHIPSERWESTPKILDSLDHKLSYVLNEEQKKILKSLYTQLKKLDRLNTAQSSDNKKDQEEQNTDVPAKAKEIIFMTYIKTALNYGLQSEAIKQLEAIFHTYREESENNPLDIIDTNTESILFSLNKNDEKLVGKIIKEIFQKIKLSTRNHDKNNFIHGMEVLNTMNKDVIQFWNNYVIKEFNLNKKRNRILSDNYLILVAGNLNPEDIDTRYNKLQNEGKKLATTLRPNK